jgi:acyl-CoA reductase-like NAD-dependent aldehyde dehydrogenase
MEKTALKPWKFFLSGKEHESNDILRVKSPFTGEVVGETFLATPNDLNDAVQSAVEGFEETKRLPAYERSEILFKVRDGIAKEAEAFARLMALEAGKPLKDARLEVSRALLTFATAAEETKRIHGEFLDLNVAKAGLKHYAVYRPFQIGPILAITPFNFPLNLVAHKIAPAMAVGTSFVLKPASATPLTALKLAQIILEAGYPPKAVNVLPCTSSAGEALVKDERLKLLSFTGSPAVGWKLKALSGKKKVVLELGGNAGVVVDQDADVEYAVERCAVGGFSYAGQSCISVQRIFVHEKIAKSFTELFVSRVKHLKLGDPLDETVDVGPMISEESAIRVERWIAEAEENGAKILAGGKRNRSMLEPTVITNVVPSMKVSCQEVFAPIVTLTPFSDFKEVLHFINDSQYGLQAGIFSNNFSNIMLAYQELEVGGVIVGDVPTWRIDPMPYGGVKDSGLGREGVRYAMQEMMEGKLLVLNLEHML